jgi:hypothetical protein
MSSFFVVFGMGALEMAGFCIETFDALASANELAAMVIMNVVGE